jgi:hypothetical protein
MKMIINVPRQSQQNRSRYEDRNRENDQQICKIHTMPAPVMFLISLLKRVELRRARNMFSELQFEWLARMQAS